MNSTVVKDLNSAEGVLHTRECVTQILVFSCKLRIIGYRQIVNSLLTEFLLGFVIHSLEDQFGHSKRDPQRVEDCI